ncbi:DUF4124 domain-containing protein [Geomonas nitrogeniifigens]|uniref:DUF4124 domain-containing protein n=1 Tax=Geomonas diazotrophica TaxID=2843197 RepID=A0ABX8JJ64_9BACT|nr:DUF4124 domain-containing protein [Geomonas nitrogeniifigens]QWV98420.1 DUF4124 domain-containing protein [Geomonas nitrogeniifigens]QXE87602.1 DUF4124 domain-containing protein [Geomonas nitrogeniifigens]
MRRTTMVATVFLLAAPPLALGGTYQWRDDAGTVHFTDDSDRIPDKYLKRAREVDPASAAKPAATVPKPEAPAAPPAAKEAAAAATAADAESTQRARVAAELAQARSGLEGKKQELQKLHHKWMVTKGRTPTPDEAREFQKQLAEGKTTDEKNPYVSKNRALSSSSAARAAYYKKLEEVREDDARVQRLERELEALK